MFNLFASIFLFAAFIWTVVDRVKFERSSKTDIDHKVTSVDYKALFRDHNRLQIMLYLCLAVYFLLEYLKIS